MNHLILTLCFVFAFGNLRAHNSSCKPSPGHSQLPIWPGIAPDAQFGPPANAEAAKPGEVDNVSHPR
jgi:hypothetical protein